MNTKRRGTIVFDLDGTLLDTLSDLQHSLNTVLERHAYPVHPLEAVRQFVGDGIGKLVARAIPNGEANPDYPLLFAEMRSHYAQHCRETTKPYAGVCDVLARLHEARFSLAIVSNKPDAQVQALREAFFAEWVSVAIGESTQTRIKPAPDTVFLALERLNKPREDAIYVGDSEVDFATAQNAGLPCVNVLWGFRTKQELLPHGATQFAETPDALLQQLETQDWVLPRLQKC